MTPNFTQPSMVFDSGLMAPSWQVMEIALVIVTILPAAIVIWAATGLQRTYKDWTVCWLASIFCINVFVPHIPASVLVAGYTPGILSAVFINLPLCLLLLQTALVERRATKPQLIGAFAVGAISLPFFIIFSFSVADIFTGS